MDINDVNNISNNVNLNNIPKQYVEKSKYSNSINQIDEKEDALRVSISDIYNKKRDELSLTLQNLNEGIAISQISLNALSNQEESLKNIDKALIKLEIGGDYENSRFDTANEISKELNNYNNEAQSAIYKKRNLLDDQYGDDVINIITNNTNYTIKGINTKEISQTLFNELQTNTLSTKEEIDSAIDNVNKAIDKNLVFSSNYEELQKDMKQNARSILNEQLNLLKENSKLKNSNFGTDATDFSKSNISSKLGHLAASQAHIIQEQSSKLLS